MSFELTVNLNLIITFVANKKAIFTQNLALQCKKVIICFKARVLSFGVL